MIRALIFDFDGLIVDTEGPDYAAWREIYTAHGHDLALDIWCECIGRSADYFDPIADLEAKIGAPLDRERLEKQHRRRHGELIATGGVLPGIESYLEDARRLGLKLAIASSSQQPWVIGHLRRLGLDRHWEHFSCWSEGLRAKPEPDLYQRALEALAIEAAEAIAFEDSPNGVRAAKAAGLFCVAVPNPLTARLDLGHADLTVPSLEGLPLRALIESVEAA